MRQLVFVVALTALTGSPADAQTANPPCNRRMVVSGDSVRAIAKRLHPESVDIATSRAFVTVGLVFDAECRLVHHAIGRRSGPGHADVVLARLIPEAIGNTYVTSGFATLPVNAKIDSLVLHQARNDVADVGTPWVVWGVQARR